ncbi:serine/threonine-protein kinase ULK1-like isoform X2 [Sinocyclocheilus rhinocerous]|uniref:serine/threonine-protein kinase ULK1-like isoform X2 n=1 Tax=Sinocyclocheilus rhinocerous TaxID=307959 RepID=UPI0007B829E8|nr:PREDICTED: serine/threonine-protein kinase ULK1-like isoform X2 [Sinocyclocheilus rhinocerous]
MESVGKYEFSRKDLIGHGAFAVVFKGRHKQKHDFEVAVKCINKKNLAKSQSLLGKEIRILKELKHENIVSLLDFQEILGCVYLVMEYCNGGDLAEYLHSKGSLSEDTICVLLQQLAGAMSVLRSKGIIHRDLKPQNILISYSTGRRSNPNNICIKLADFGFARYLQGNTMAATLCGSPMYMAPEVIMSQNYDAKADLWSVGTIIYQCLTGKAPFQASTPQELRQFYERHQSLSPSIPRETSSHLRHLLLGLLQRNHGERMDFDEFFHHPFLEASTSMKKSSPVPMPTYPSSASGSSSSGSSTSRLTPTQSETEAPRPLPQTNPTPSPGSLLKDSSSSESDDFVMVPAQFTSELVSAGGQDCLMRSGSSLPGVGRIPSSSPSVRASPSPSRPLESCVSSYAQSVPVPVPTQKLNYQRMEQNLQVSDRTAAPVQHVPTCGRTGASPESGGSRPYLPSPQVGNVPETPNQPEPVGSRTGLHAADVCKQPGQVSPLFTDITAMDKNQTHRLGGHRHNPESVVHRTPSTALVQRGLITRNKTMSDLKDLALYPATGPRVPLLRPAERRYTVKRSLSTGRLSDKLLKAVFGHQFDRGSCESLNSGKPMDTTAPPGGSDGTEQGSGSPAGVVFILCSPEYGHTPPHATRRRRFSVGTLSPTSPGWTYGHVHEAYSLPDSLRYGYTDAMATNLCEGVAFVPPELPEETIMEEGHTDLLSQLRFILAFSHCVTEIARTKDSGIERNVAVDASFLEQSVVADQVSLLSHEWSSAEQLVLYMKCAELLSSALHTAMAGIKEGKLFPSGSVKQVVRKLNEMYKKSVNSCRSLTEKLQLFFSSKQRLMDRINSITAERLIYTHTIQMVQTAALDEMFHHGETSVERYHKALLLMEGLSLIITETADLNSINKCRQCIERRLSSLQPKGCV